MWAKRLSSLFVVSIMVFLGGLGLAAPDGGRIGSPDYQQILRYLVMGAGGEVPEREYVFITAGGITQSQMAELEELGITVVSALGETVEVRGPITAFEALGPGSAAFPWVHSVLPSPYLKVSGAMFPDWIPTDVLEKAVGAPPLHEKGYRGEGINVAIIDTGFTGAIAKDFGEERVHYYQVDYARDTKAPYLTQGYDPSGFGDHGEACARGILDIAPGVNLYLFSAATINDRKAVLNILRSGRLQIDTQTVTIDVLSDSTYCPVPFDHADGRGEFAQYGDAVVKAGIFYVTALGNFASGENTSRSFFGGVFWDDDSDGLLDLTPGALDPTDRNSLSITMDPSDLFWYGWGSASLQLDLEWDGWPWQVREGVDTEDWQVEDFVRIQDLDLVLYQKNDQTGEILELARMETPQLKRPKDGGAIHPSESLEYLIEEGGTYLITIENATSRYPLSGASERPVSLHLYVHSTVPFTMPEHTISGSFINMGGAREVVGVGAVEWTGDSWCVASYSSRGPTADGRLKPQIVAPTAYATTVKRYEPYFAGTSASAPIAAGVAALLIQAAEEEGLAHDSATIRDALLRSAVPLCDGCNYLCLPMALTTDGPATEYRLGNYHTGFGMINAWEAYRFMAGN